MKRVAVLIDGGFYTKQIGKVRKDVKVNDPSAVADTIRQLVAKHIAHLNNDTDWDVQHHRTLFYDARPYTGRVAQPISGEVVNFAKSDVARFHLQLFRKLKQQRNMALRLGVCMLSEPEWQINPEAMDELLAGDLELNALDDSHFKATIRQKGVDTRLGLDLASMVLKKQAEIFVLVAGDADFVPATKLVRREGCHVILDTLGLNVSKDLREHIDEHYNAFSSPKQLRKK